MKLKKLTLILIFLILVNCVGKAKVNDPTEEALVYLNSLYPNSKPLTKEELNLVKEFYLTGTPIMDDKLKYLLIFPNLNDLRFTHTRITDEGLATLKDNKIWSLDVDATLITNKSIKILKDWKHLKHLNISYTKINRDAIPDLLKLDLQSIDAAGLNFSESDIKKLREKFSVDTEEYEIQCPGETSSKCPEF
ncbi:Leucine rich repeat protein [Leptospira santarosai]|uniref:Leucine rich repeat protein n=1 Tax=Leptospira santarosai TaxID=28183 RepID=A0A2P1QTQ2_9LEPT|nr:Leucine rich repeat protein [Leptospira santarosai]